MIKLNAFIERLIIVFSIGFIISFPFPFFIIPDVGGALAPFFTDINQFLAKLLNIDTNSVFEILSDSTGLYLHLITLFIFAFIISLIWVLLQKSIHPNVNKYFKIVLTYYLALILFKYGFDKIFKHQFYFPEPNILFTPLNKLSKDILFWSSMGTSYSYSVFSGLIELVPASLLIFKKTRLLGAFIAFAVLVNVVMINFGFDISVKVYSLFLLLLSILIISSDAKRIYRFFTNQSIQTKKVSLSFNSKQNLIKYSILKSVVIGVILFESLAPYVKNLNFNSDTFKKPFLYGAYTVVESESNDIKRIFFHQRQYFIIQYSNDTFESFHLQFSKNKTKLVITDEFFSNKKYVLSIQVGEQSVIVKGKFKEKSIRLKMKKENIKSLPISNDTFHWTFD